MANLKKNIKDEQTIVNLLSKMPKSVAESFNEEQLTHLFTVLSARSWAKHSIDARGTFKIPLYPRRFYYVFLAGKNFRNLSRKEQNLSLLTKAIIFTALIIVSSLVGLLVIYLIKSALGINIMPNFSFGIWGWFKGLWV